MIQIVDIVQEMMIIIAESTPQHAMVRMREKIPEYLALSS